MKYTSLDDAVRLLGYTEDLYHQIEDLNGEFCTINSFAKRYEGNDYALPLTKIKTLVENKLIRTENRSDGGILVSLYDVEKFYLKQKVVLENCYYIKNFISKCTGKPCKSLLPHHYEMMDTLIKLKLIDYICLSPVESLWKMDKFITKFSAEAFLDIYINLADARVKYNIPLNALEAEFKDIEQCMEVIYTKESSRFSNRFVKKDDFEKYYATYLYYINDLISEASLGKSLDLAPKTLTKVLSEYKIEPKLIVGESKKDDPDREFNGRKYYEQKIVDELLKKQEKMWEEYSDKYYTSEEFEQIVKTKLELISESRMIYDNSFFNQYRDSESTRVDNPWLIRIEKDGRYFKGIKTLYEKKIIDEYVETTLFEREYLRISETLPYQPFLAYRELVQHLNITFPECCTETVELWELFVERYYENKKIEQLVASIRGTVQTAKFLAETLKAQKKEIALMTTKELKLAIFNENVRLYIRTILHSFLLALPRAYRLMGKEVAYNIKLISRPGKDSPRRIKEVYREDEYGAYVDYCNQIEHHKQKSIEDIEFLLGNKKNNYRRYASTWLYVIIHLNNMWRRFEVTLFPRFTGMEKTKLMKACNYDYVKALTYLKNNDLDDEDIEYVANKLRAFLDIHGKNQMPRDFTWTETTSKALSTAVILCEIRCNLTESKDKKCTDEEYLIDFNSKKRELTKGSEKAFFKDFDEGIANFKSKKMNSSLSSLGYVVSKKIDSESVTEVQKSFRNHKDEESSNIYVLIPENRMNEIADNLFNSGPFGFVQVCLTDIIQGRDISNNQILTREEKALYANQLRSIFGNWIKVEEVVRVMKDLTNNQETAKRVLHSMTKDELMELNLKMKMGINHAKDEGFMCIFNSCIYEDENEDKAEQQQSCISCPFMAMNFHSLSTLCNDFGRLLDECEMRFGINNQYQHALPSNSKDSEKIYYTRQLATYSVRIHEAIKKFGEDIISMFIEGGIASARERKDALIPHIAKYQMFTKELDNKANNHLGGD
ncbi:hypothetical protein [Mesobacillus foraminis]|uniref:hypothetical protein n=1 Tax=Mesobacillus foraminis TaxID=279826 RepID=UPI000EF46F8C|nr:hypothetical protein [Mesobacillus foraminis]